jgi:multisubunit Na+/H+ antiporter MnhG subunit
VALLADLTPLRESPAFRRLWAGTTLSTVGSALTTFAVTLQVYEITRSPAAVGLIGLVVMVPLLTVGLFGGTLTDVVIGAALPAFRRYRALPAAPARVRDRSSG